MTGLGKWALVAMLGLACAAIPAVSNGRADDGTDGSFTAAIPPAVQDDIEGKFEALTAGNRKIALALFDAQADSIGSDVALTLDEIAAAKDAGAVWSELFEQMRAEGLIDQPNLGEVISGAVRKWNTRAPSVRGQTGAPKARRGAYKSLPASEHKISGLLCEHQSIGLNGQHAWSLDQIATARQNGVGWAVVLKRMRADGLIRATTIEEAVRASTPHVERANPARAVVVTSGSGSHVVVTTGSRSRNN